MSSFARVSRHVWPTLLIVIAFAALAVVADAATRAAAPLTSLTDVRSEERAGEDTRWPALAAASTTVSASPYERDIVIVTPPPAEPAAPARGGARGSGGRAPSTPPLVSYQDYCAAGGGWTATPSNIDGLLSAANAERARFGFAPLTWSPSLASLAQTWSESMAADYDPSSPGSAMQHGSLPPSPGGQNVAAAWTNGGSMSLGTAMSYAHHGWMTSTHGHCTNILNPAWTTMGAGAAQSADGRAWYTTQNFGG